MRPHSWTGLAILFLLTTAAFAAKSYNEAAVQKLDGTIMVQREGEAKPMALQTGSTIQKGDILTVYDKSWTILRTKRGDRIGLSPNTVLAIDEYHIEGPDRQIRLLLKQGSILLRTNDSSSRQSFFEVHSGQQVVVIGDTEAILDYEPETTRLKVRFLTGKLSVIDKESEEKFAIEHSENSWEAGKRLNGDPSPVEELDVVNFQRFFDGEAPLEAPDNNIILPDRDGKKIR